MSTNANCTAFFGDAVHEFRLGIGQIEELQRKTECGPRELYNRILQGRWRLADLRETIRIGLIGGGMTPFEAANLIEVYAVPPHLVACEKPALAILLAALVGPPDGGDEDGDAGEPMGEPTTADRVSPTDGLTSPPSTKSPE